MRATVYGGADMTALRRMLPLVLIWAGCSAKAGPAIPLRVAHLASGDGHCAEAGSDDLTVSSLNTVTTVRLSFREHQVNDDAGMFLCDSIIKVGGRSDLQLHLPSSEKSIDVYAEGFAQVMDADSATAGDFRRVATGALLRAGLNSKSFGPLRLYPVETFHCAAAPMVHPRGFHSATLLPNGQVLYVGGVTASSDASSETLTNNLFYLTGGAEIYDPSDGTFKAVSEPSPAPRAFHQAFYLGDDGMSHYKVLLIGGVTTKDGTSSAPALGVTNTGVGGPRLVPFDTSPTIPAPLATIGATAELAVSEPTGPSITRTPVDGFTAAAYLAGTALTDATGNADGFIVAGGIDYVDPLETTMPTGMSIRVERASETTPRTCDLQAGRIGASLVQFDNDTAFLWGGGLTNGAAQAEVITGLTIMSTVSSSALGLPGAPSTQFQTATVLDGSSGTVLVTGGFSVDGSGNATQPPPATTAAQLITADVAGAGISNAPVAFGGTYVDDSATCTMPARYRPAGWESAVTLPNGRGVLIAGGAPTFDMTRNCNDCEAGSTPRTFLCSSRQVSLYTANALSPAPDQLQVGRFGHSATNLPDGTVLIAGGVTLPPGGTDVRLAGDGEVYNPRTAVPPYNLMDPMPCPSTPTIRWPPT